MDNHEKGSLPASMQNSAFGVFLKFVEEVEAVLFLSIHAVQSMKGITELTEAMIDFEKRVNKKHTSEEERDNKVNFARKLETLAERENEQNFPLIISHSVVAIWSALEAAINNHLAEWLHGYPQALSPLKKEKLRLPVAAFELKGSEDFARLVIEEISRQLNSSLKPGVGRFEALLEYVGISGGIDDNLRKDLFELSQVRNLVVHKFSIVDSRFKSACPWIDVEIGQRLKITEDDFYRYYNATRKYSASVLRRTADRTDEIMELKNDDGSTVPDGS